MSVFLPIANYILIVISFLQGWIVVAVGLAIYFSWRYSAAWLLPLAILLDGYFGRFETVPWLSLLAVTWFALFDMIKPRLVQYGGEEK
jgi:hypothetical protein